MIKGKTSSFDIQSSTFDILLDSIFPVNNCICLFSNPPAPEERLGVRRLDAAFLPESHHELRLIGSKGLVIDQIVGNFLIKCGEKRGGRTPAPWSFREDITLLLSLMRG
jgi:hypothetical protein